MWFFGVISGPAGTGGGPAVLDGGAEFFQRGLGSEQLAARVLKIWFSRPEIP